MMQVKYLTKYEKSIEQAELRENVKDVLINSVAVFFFGEFCLFACDRTGEPFLLILGTACMLGSIVTTVQALLTLIRR